MQFPFSTFYQTGCDILFMGYSLSHLLFLEMTSFLFTSATKEKILCCKTNFFSFIWC